MARQRRGLTGNLLPWLLAVFICRAIVPVGYMPATAGQGGPFALCEGASWQTLELFGLADHRTAAAGADSANHSSHVAASAHLDHGDSDSHDTRWAHCPLGVGAADAPFAVHVEFAADSTAGVFDGHVLLSRSGSQFSSTYRARAPPFRSFV